jgi:tripeptidyl-peptidase-1
VTSVGGTTGGSSTPEVAAPLSGGGFSNYFKRPEYQEDAVPAFLGQNKQLVEEYAGLFK